MTADPPEAIADNAWRKLVFPPGHRNPVPAKRYHLVVIGAGPAGLVTAMAAAGLGARVALVEETAMGGDCLNVGCVPSKALLEATRKLALARSPTPVALTGDMNIDAARAFSWLRRVRADIAQHDSVARFQEAGVDVFLGSAQFTADQTVRVGDCELRARRFAVCTGARPAIPAIPGLAAARPHTNETIFDLESAPGRLAILGAGPIGCELAQAFALLGSRVTVVDLAARVLPREDPDGAALVQQSLEALGIEFRLASAIQSVSRRENSLVVEAGGRVEADVLLAALGRRANTAGLGLEQVGVATDEQGRIRVDSRQRSSNPRVYAAGDCCSGAQFTHHADAQARVVVQNALFLATARADRLITPRCTYTWPELAQIGATRQELEHAGRRFDCYRVAFSELDRGRTQGEAGSFAQVLTEPGRDRIIGATIAAAEAGELLAPLALLMNHGLGLGALGRVELPYPTRSEFLKRMADDYARRRLTPRVAALMRWWFRLRE